MQRVHFFVSYTAADEAWAEWAARVLEDAGFTTRLQAWDFGPGHNFVLAMHEALLHSDRVLVVLSDAYLRSPLAAVEWAEALAADPRGRAGRLLPIRVAACKPEGLLRAIVYVDLVGLDEAEAQRRLLAGVVRGRVRPAVAPVFPTSPHSDTASVLYPGTLPGIWNVPGRNPHFAGRSGELDRLRGALETPTGAVAVLAISGLGGVGKTQLAVEHAWRRAADYDLVWWLPAEVPAAIPDSLAALAERLALPISDETAVVELIHAELARRRRWLMIFDNAKDPRSIAAYMPSGDGHVLVTSRNPAWRSVAVSFEVDVLFEEDAVAFLLSRTDSQDGDAARAVARDLAFLPLALEQAGAYVEETAMPLATYWKLLAERRGEVLRRGTPAFYDETVAVTFSLAYDQAATESPAAAQVLGNCAVLAPEDIPTELIATDDLLEAEDAIAILRRLALLHREGASLGIHRVVASVVRQRLGPAEVRARAATEVAALDRAFPVPPDDHRNWVRCARLLPHIMSVAEHAEPTESMAALLNMTGIYLSSRSQLRAAVDVLERALGVFEVAYGSDHHDTALTLVNLAIARQALGHFAEARTCLERALMIFEATHGPNHPDVAIALSNLGTVLQSLGDVANAREILERALRIKEVAYGSFHPQVAITLTNLGTALQALGDLAGARERLERALQIKEVAYGPDHPQVALTLGNLGTVLHALGDLAGARRGQERALQIKEAAYGADHPEVARTLTNLGTVLQALGDLRGARENLERALRIKEATYGPDHPQVGLTLTGLGYVLSAIGDRAGARHRHVRALRIFEVAHGPDHAFTRAATQALAAL